MKVLGLDVSSRSTGWFVTKRSCGIIAPGKDLEFPAKLSFFRQELAKLLEKYKPDVVVLEDCYYRPGFGSIHTVKSLSKFAGVAIELCNSYKIKVEIITATRARKYCCGKEKLDKRGVFDFFVGKFELVDWKFEKDNDKTDAMALSWGYREIYKEEAKSNNKKKSAKKGSKK